MRAALTGPLAKRKRERRCKSELFALGVYPPIRVGRSLAHLTKLLADLEGRGVHFRTVEDGLDTRGSTGKLVFHLLGAVAQFERDLIIERTRAGLAAARNRGKRLGPPVKWQADMARKAQVLMDNGDLNAEEVRVSRRTLFGGFGLLASMMNFSAPERMKVGQAKAFAPRVR